MSRFQIQIAEAAQQDLAGIVDYIANHLRERQTALNQLARLQEAIDSLQEMPERQSLVHDNYLSLLGIRKIPVDNYLVFYLVDNNRHIVHIIRVLYAKREWEKLL